MSAGIVVISGPSGVGKGTVLRALLQRLGKAHLAVSVTTRPPRPGERDGIDYTFLTEQSFDEAERTGQLLESSRYGGHRYGTPVTELATDRLTVIECDVRGAARLRQALPRARLIFIVDSQDHGASLGVGEANRSVGE